MTGSVQIEQIAAPVTWRLRQEVLYPEGSLQDVMIDEDFDGYHFGAYAENELVGVISLFAGSSGRFQIRKFAVHPVQQRRGIGSELLSHVLSFAQTLGANIVWCHARTAAIGFYNRFGLQPVGACFLRNDISYIRLELIVKS